MTRVSGMSLVIAISVRDSARTFLPATVRRAESRTMIGGKSFSASQNLRLEARRMSQLALAPLRRENLHRAQAVLERRIPAVSAEGHA